jgi:hypothetical protein
LIRAIRTAYPLDVVSFPSLNDLSLIGTNNAAVMSAIPTIRSIFDDAFRVPLRDLGEFDERLAGILCPEPELGAEKVGITDQFLAEAETYSRAV